MMAKGIIPRTSKYAMMTVGIPQKDYADKILEAADLVIAIGYDLVEFAPSRWNPKGTKRIVHVGAHPAHVNKRYQCKVEVVGDIGESLENIMGRATRTIEPVRMLEIKKKFREEQEAFQQDSSFPMKPQKILMDVRKVLGKEDVLISDVGAHKMWIGRFYDCDQPNTCIISNGFASMGIGVPGAVAAKLVKPDKRVLAVVGDGGFMINCQELETAVRIGVSFVVLVFHDCHYGLIKWKQMEQYHRCCHVDFSNPDFVKLAEAMNCKGYRIENAEELVPTLEEAFCQEAPAVIDCRVDYRENIKLSKYLEEIYDKL